MKASSSNKSSPGPALLDRRHRAERPATADTAHPAVSLAILSAIDEAGRPWIRFPRETSREPLLARHACALGPDDLGREAVLAYEGGDPSKPIILGLLQVTQTGAPAMKLSADGQELTVSAARQLVLQCGKASITLTRAGKVLIRGAYVSTRSSGVNRIKGGSVQIN
jgi:hypothetical protein